MFIVLSPILFALCFSTSLRLWSSSLKKSSLKALSRSWQACLQKCFCPTWSDGDNHSLFLRGSPVVIDAKTLHGTQATQASIDAQYAFTSTWSFPTHSKNWGHTTQRSSGSSHPLIHSGFPWPRGYNLWAGWAPAIFLQNPGCRMHSESAKKQVIGEEIGLLSWHFQY